jgi:hypothetical protein
LEFFAVSYQVFKYYSESACFSQKSCNVFFAIILFIYDANIIKMFSKYELFSFLINGISDQFKISVKYIRVGEGIDDLQVFNKDEFVG